MLKICIYLIEFYQKYLSFDTGMLNFMAPGGACKSIPRCSEYTKQAIIKYGVLKGSWMGAKRIWSCR